MTERAETIGEWPRDKREDAIKRERLAFMSTFLPDNYGKDPDEFVRAVDATYPQTVIEKVEAVLKVEPEKWRREVLQRVLRDAKSDMDQR